MDFDDLLVNSAKLLLDDDRRQRGCSGAIRFILVDEYQDTNKLQAEVIDMARGARRNVMVVGDDAQSIYSFRGASFENIMKFPERYPEAQVFRIELNYRSVPEILRVANAAIAANVKQFRKESQRHAGFAIDEARTRGAQ